MRSVLRVTGWLVGGAGLLLLTYGFAFAGLDTWLFAVIAWLLIAIGISIEKVIARLEAGERGELGLRDRDA